MDRKEAIIVNFFNELLDLYEFELCIDTNLDSENIFRLNDRQGANWSEIEQDEFYTLADIIERLSSPHEDYIYKSLEERKDANEIIPRNDWDLTAKRYLESDIVANILSEINVKKYKEVMKQKEKFEIKDIIEILDSEESFCKNICQKYVNTISKEMLLEKDNKILHIFIDDDYIDLKEQGKITSDNYEEYLDGNYEVYEYDYYKEFFDGTVKNEIVNDLNDLALFDEENQWDFYISFEELKKLGYGFMVKDNYPLLEKYAIPEDKQFDFYNYFSLEQLEDFEQSLNQYFIEESIIYNKDSYDELESKEDADFNRDILRLACGLITYEDFIEDYTEHPLNYYDLSLPKVIEYFKENQIKDLIDYGCDTDEGLNKLSSLYTEIMDKLNIKYSDVYTEDGISPGKYITTIFFENNSKIDIDTNAWEGIKGVTSNMESIYKFYENSKQNEVQNDKDFEYDYN